jgi:uncharacterized membrane protein YphA (DoxX/SURF4 family)
MTELTGSVNANARAWTGGRLTASVARHALAWELVTAGLTVLYEGRNAAV